MILIHAQGVDAVSFENVCGQLSKKYHIFSLDCYGHGESLHNAKQYNLEDISKAVICFIEDVVQEKVFLLGHSSRKITNASEAKNDRNGGKVPKEASRQKFESDVLAKSRTERLSGYEQL